MFLPMKDAQSLAKDIAQNPLLLEELITQGLLPGLIGKERIQRLTVNSLKIITQASEALSKLRYKIQGDSIKSADELDISKLSVLTVQYPYQVGERGDRNILR